MESFALPLILLSAVLHALWNLLAKRAKTSGIVLVFLFAVVETAIFLPLTIYLVYELQEGTLNWVALGFMLGSSALHIIYFWLLSMGYRVGDLSVVYPIARGTGPLLSTIGDMLLFAENPSSLTLLGTVMICVGVVILTGNPRLLFKSESLTAVNYGMLTGLTVAAYTLWDAYAMNQISIAPLIFQGGLSITRMLILLPLVARRREAVVKSWQLDQWKIIGIAIMSSSAYLIILFVLKFAPVSYVAPMRALSILIGVLLGTNLLKEQNMRRRVIAAGAVIIGVVLLNS